MKLSKHIFGFTLVEMMISLSVFAVISGVALLGIVQVGKSIGRTKNTIKAREDLSAFTQGLYVFINKSVGAYFLKNTPNIPANELNYVNEFPAIKIAATTAPPLNSILDTLYLVKDTAGATGTIVYNPTAHTLSWFKVAGDSSRVEVMLTDVYRMDYINDTIPGVAPIFRFPHDYRLYETASVSRPLFILIEFRKRIAKPNSVEQTFLSIPIKLMCQLHTIK